MRPPIVLEYPEVDGSEADLCACDDPRECDWCEVDGEAEP